MMELSGWTQPPCTSICPASPSRAHKTPEKTRSGRFALAHSFRGHLALVLMGSEEKCHDREAGLRKAAHLTAGRSRPKRRGGRDRNKTSFKGLLL